MGLSDAQSTFKGDVLQAVDAAMGPLVDEIQAEQQAALTQARADVAALTLEVDNLTAQGERDRQTIAADAETVKSLNAQVTAGTAALTQAQADLAKANARIKELEAQVPVPDYVPVYGISVNDTKGETAASPGDVARIEKLTSLDAVQAVRVFYGGSLPTNWASDPALTNSYANGVRIFHLSVKSALTTAQAAAFKATAPADVTIYATEHHEPENDPFNTASWRASQTSASTAARASGMDFTLTLMGWTFNTASGRNPEDYWVDGIYDAVTVDVYNKDMDVVLPKVKAFADAHGVPWGISETGASTAVKGKPQSQADRVQWAKDARAAVAANQPQLPVLWWDVKSASGFDNTLNDELADVFFGIV